MNLPTSFIPELESEAKRIVRKEESEVVAPEKKVDTVEKEVVEPKKKEVTSKEMEEEVEAEEVVEVKGEGAINVAEGREDEDIVVPDDNWEKSKTLKELRNMCVQRNLSSNGKKSDLVERIRSFDAGS